MGILGGKINEDIWTIETNSINTDGDSKSTSNECSCTHNFGKNNRHSRNSVCLGQSKGERLILRSAVPIFETVSLNEKMEQIYDQRQRESGRLHTNTTDNNGLSRGSYINKKYQLYKTEMCRSHTEIGYCRYGDKCQFAHSESELRHVQRHPKYKTETCKTFWEEGSCPYGKRCCFIHVPNIHLRVAPLQGDGRDRKDRDFSDAHKQVTKEIDESAQDKVIYTNIDKSMSYRNGHFHPGLENKVDKEGRIEDAFRFMEYGLDPAGFFGVGSRRGCVEEPRVASSFEPLMEDACNRDTMARKPFWETNDANIWMADEMSLFYLKNTHSKQSKGGHLAPGGLVCKTFDKKISEFVLEHLNM